MKYMVMMFGTASDMMQTRDPEWIREMIQFMVKVDQDLRDSGELVFADGLANPEEAFTVRLRDGMPVATDGPFAEVKESIIGFWVLDVASRERIIEFGGQIAKWSDVVEVRAIAGPPPMD